MTDKRPKPAIDDQIVENLQRAYNRTLDESVPDRFIDLLRQLRDQDSVPAEDDDGK